MFGLLIVLAVNYAVTAFLAVHDLFENREKDQLSFGDAFKKYFAKNNIPTKFYGPSTHWNRLIICCNWDSLYRINQLGIS